MISWWKILWFTLSCWLESASPYRIFVAFMVCKKQALSGLTIKRRGNKLYTNVLFSCWESVRRCNDSHQRLETLLPLAGLHLTWLWPSIYLLFSLSWPTSFPLWPVQRKRRFTLSAAGANCSLELPLTVHRVYDDFIHLDCWCLGKMWSHQTLICMEMNDPLVPWAKANAILRWTPPPTQSKSGKYEVI